MTPFVPLLRRYQVALPDLSTQTGHCFDITELALQIAREFKLDAEPGETLASVRGTRQQGMHSYVSIGGGAIVHSPKLGTIKVAPRMARR